MEEKVTMNKMGIVPIPKILLTMGIPMIFSMVLQACYNIVDSIFVAGIPDQDGILHMGEKAMNALTLAFPVQMLIVALAIGTGVGVNALLARTLGQKDMEKVSRVAGNGVFLGFVIYAVFVLFGLFGVDLYLKTQTEDTVVLEMAGSYLRICSLLCVGNVMFAVYEKLLQSTGKAVFSTISQIGGALVNIVLDPILIYGLIGLPAMGVAGAAWATVIGQWVSMFLGAFLHYKKNHEVKSGLSYVKPNKRVIFEIYQIGFPAIIMQALMSFMTYGINIIFKVVSDGAVAAYGVFYKIQQFLFFAGFGLRDAITPIVSFNYGMGAKKRVNQGIRYGLLYTEIIMFFGIFVLEIFAEPLVSLFHLTSQTTELCILAIRIISPGFLLAGINIALQGVFQALDCGIGSLVVSLLRLLVVVLPLAWLFARMENASFMIWFAFPLAEAAAVVAALLFLTSVHRKMNHQK